MRRFLLDTNLLLGLTRRAPWAEWAYNHFDFGSSAVICFTSVVCVGELRALAEKFGWGRQKRGQLDAVIEELPTLPINDPDILTAYALIDAWSSGKPVAAPHGAPPTKPAITMGKNDLWIAATAHVTGAVLLSTDGDFEHLDGVWFKYERVDQTATPSEG